jgi:hypothetical protein
MISSIEGAGAGGDASEWPQELWNEEYMPGILKHELKRRGKPIPAVLQSQKYDK